MGANSLTPEQLVELRMIALDLQRELERCGLAKLLFWADIAATLNRIDDRIGWLEVLGHPWA